MADDLFVWAEAMEARPQTDLGELLARWWNWHHSQPEFWPLFERFAFQAVNSGRRKISGWLIVNRIRWESAVIRRREEDEFKISNDFIAVYTRLFAHRHPAHATLFDTSQMKRVADEEWPELWRRLELSPR